MQKKEYKVKHGSPYPAGSRPNAGGVNFSIFSRYAEHVELLLFESADSEEPFQIITLEKESNRTFFSWHVYVSKLPIGTWYTWRMEGPDRARESGFRFDKEKHLGRPLGARRQPKTLEPQSRLSAGRQQRYRDALRRH